MAKCRLLDTPSTVPGDRAARSNKMAPMTARPVDVPARSRDLARLRSLTSPHLPYPAAPIGPTLAQMTPGDWGEVVAILSRLADPWKALLATRT